jgi:hypothetical protein
MDARFRAWLHERKRQPAGLEGSRELWWIVLCAIHTPYLNALLGPE